VKGPVAGDVITGDVTSRLEVFGLEVPLVGGPVPGGALRAGHVDARFGALGVAFEAMSIALRPGLPAPFEVRWRCRGSGAQPADAVVALVVPGGCRLAGRRGAGGACRCSIGSGGRSGPRR